MDQYNGTQLPKRIRQLSFSPWADRQSRRAWQGAQGDERIGAAAIAGKDVDHKKQSAPVAATATSGVPGRFEPLDGHRPCEV